MSVVEILTSVMRQNRSMCQLQLSRKFAGSVSHLMTTPVRSDSRFRHVVSHETCRILTKPVAFSRNLSLFS